MPRLLHFQLAATLALAGCAPTIAGYQQQAYRNATVLKAETGALMAVADRDDYAGHAADAARTGTAIAAALDYAAGIPGNDLSATQWRLYKTGIYDRFVATWAAQGKVSPGYRALQQASSDQALDYIICLEANKKAAATCTPAGGGQ